MSGQDIRSLYQEELIQVVREMGGRDFQGKQLFRWLHQKQVGSYQEMTDLPKAVRSQLEEGYPLTSLYPVDTQVSALDGTRKFLFALADGQMVESVWMHYRHGDSVCISSQAGCRMGCRFCASTIGGLIRGLSAGEMLEQVYAVGRAMGKPVSHVVVMGTGEPLDNYDQLLRFIRILSHEQGMHMSQRNMTVSTCGIVPRIYDLAREKLQILLQQSLYGSRDIQTDVEKDGETLKVSIEGLHDTYGGLRWKFHIEGSRKLCRPVSFIRKAKSLRETGRQLGGGS